MLQKKGQNKYRRHKERNAPTIRMNLDLPSLAYPPPVASKYMSVELDPLALVQPAATSLSCFSLREAMITLAPLCTKAVAIMVPRPLPTSARK